MVRKGVGMRDLASLASCHIRLRQRHWGSASGHLALGPILQPLCLLERLGIGGRGSLLSPDGWWWGCGWTHRIRGFFGGQGLTMAGSPPLPYALSPGNVLKELSDPAGAVIYTSRFQVGLVP